MSVIVYFCKDYVLSIFICFLSEAYMTGVKVCYYYRYDYSISAINDILKPAFCFMLCHGSESKFPVRAQISTWKNS